MDARPDLITLMYHEISDDLATTGFQRPSVASYAFSPRVFSAHLSAIADAGLSPVRIGDAGVDEPGRRLLLTFDDGGRSALKAAAQLEVRGWRAHFFIVTARVGSPTFLDRGALSALRAAGHVVGSHSHTHPDIFRDLPPERMREQWHVSLDRLAEILGEPVTTASVPGGDISPVVLASAAESGVRHLFTSEPWRRPRRVAGCWVLGRVCLRAGATAETVRELALGRGWMRVRLERHLKSAARRVLAPVYRHYVRQLTSPDPACD